MQIFKHHLSALIQDIIDFRLDKETEEAILFLDFRKAFDTVEVNFIKKALTFFNFGTS